MNRQRNAKIIATLGPASSTREKIVELFQAGADVFRLNFSHGKHEDHRERYETIRDIEREFKRPITILLDLQGPKLRVGTFEDGKVNLKAGKTFRFDLDQTPGNSERVCLPHPEIFKAIQVGSNLLIDDGKLRLTVISARHDQIEATVVVGGDVSNRKGVNVPDVVLPISAITEKDRADLAFGLELGVDWIALSFVQKPEDLILARELIQDKALLVAKLEKPKAIDQLAQIICLSDAVMVARGDLGVEMFPEDVPVVQRQIIAECRKQGKPVIVATQMLESMIQTPTPTRAEASDVATAIYEGVDAVMLSAESASGEYPVESVQMMDRIIQRVERDPQYRRALMDYPSDDIPNIPDAISCAVGSIASTIDIKAVIVFTATGYSAFRIAKERPKSPILALTPDMKIAQRLGLLWGANPVLTHEIFSFPQMVDTACRAALAQGMVDVGDQAVLIAGVPFGAPGGSNIIHIVHIEETHRERGGNV